MVTKIIQAAFTHLVTTTIRSLATPHEKLLDINPIPVQVSFHLPGMVVKTISAPYICSLVSSRILTTPNKTVII